ncbi:MAG: Uncharacterised protein [Flavobacteriia bacterium]|nr:MAG: Uncharacterised protein [Flavobacteriia bacterium]
MPLEHGSGDLLCVGEVSDTGFHYINTRNGQAFIEFALKYMVHFLHPRPKGDLLLIVIKIVIGIVASHFTNGGIGLNANEMLVIIHLKGGFEGVFHTPDQDHTDHDRVAEFIVHFHPLAVEIAGFQTDLLFPQEGIEPEESILSQCACVGSKEGEYAAHVGIDDRKPGKMAQPKDSSRDRPKTALGQQEDGESDQRKVQQKM